MSAVLALSLAFGACSTAVSTLGFPAADADEDGMISTAEFREFFDDTDAFERIDDNDDNSLSREEYNEGVDDEYETNAHFTGLDRDANGSLSRDEFIDGWYGMFDSDKNGSLTRTEFSRAIGALEFELD